MYVMNINITNISINMYSTSSSTDNSMCLQNRSLRAIMHGVRLCVCGMEGDTCPVCLLESVFT